MIYAAVTYSDPAIPVSTLQAPIVTITYDETAAAPTDRCYTSAFNGYISPLVRADPTTAFTLNLKTKYSANAQISAAKQVLDLASLASSAFGGAGLALNTLNAATLQQKAQAVDSALAALMSGTDTDIRVETLPSANSNDAFIVRLVAITPSNLAGVSLSSLIGALAVVELVPVQSVFASRPSDSDTAQTYKAAYVTQPNQILQTQVATGKQILDVINGDPFIRTYSSLKTSPDAGKMGEACKALSNTLSNTLRLASDDELIARWAVLKTNTDYDDADFRMRSDSCWSKSDETRASALDGAFVFTKVRPNPSSTIKPQLDALDITLLNALNDLMDGHYAGLEKIVDVNSFQIVSWGTTLPSPAGGKWSDLTGSASLAALSKFGPIGAGCWQAPKPPADLTKSSIMLRVAGVRYPVAVIRDENQKITRLIFGDETSVSSYVNTPPGWPQRCE
jgi:hypothetical protein